LQEVVWFCSLSLGGVLVMSYTRDAEVRCTLRLLHFFLFISFHPFSFFASRFIPYHFYFPFQRLFPRILHSPPLFIRSAPFLPLASFPPLLSAASPVPSDRFLCLSTSSSNASRAAFRPTASGAASLCALLMRLRAGKSRKSGAPGSPRRGRCGARAPRGQRCSPCRVIW